MGRIIVFDLDRTVIRFGSYTPFLLFYARKCAPLRLLFAPLVICAMLAYTARLISRDRLKEIMLLLLVGRVEKSRMDKVANQFADYILAEKCYRKAVSAINDHLKAGDTLILATASFAFYAKHIAKRLGFHHTLGSEVATSDHHYHPKMVGENCYGQAKANKVSAFLKAHDLPSTPDLFYTDDYSDMPTINLSRSCVLVNPDTKLRAYGEATASATIVNWQ